MNLAICLECRASINARLDRPMQPAHRGMMHLPAQGTCYLLGCGRQTEYYILQVTPRTRKIILGEQIRRQEQETC